MPCSRLQRGNGRRSLDLIMQRWPWSSYGRGFRVHSKGIDTIEPRLIDRAIADLDVVTMRTTQRGHSLFGAAADQIRSEALIL